MKKEQYIMWPSIGAVLSIAPWRSVCPPRASDFLKIGKP